MTIPHDSDYASSTAYDTDEAIEYDSFRFSDRSGMRIHDSEFSVLEKALQEIELGSKVLEVGCGTGRLMLEVSKRGFNVDGADASEPMLGKAREKYSDFESSEVPEFMHCEANNVPVESGTYDLTYSIRLLNQTDSPRYALTVVSEMFRTTKPSGYVLIEFINHYRPRLGMNKRPTTRLKPKEVYDVATSSGGIEASWHGAFFLSMQGYKKSPDFLLPLVSGFDRVLSSIFPRLCSRTYLLMKKSG